MSGDSFRNKADHIFDEGKTLNPSKVKKNDIVFLKTELKEIFFNYYHKKISNSYILICHNSDDSFNESDFQFIDSKIIHCFAQKLNMPMNNLISPILLTLPLQMLAYHVALLKNCDVDKPRNLAKSVTVE